MNNRRPTTAGIDQLSLNLSITRSPDTPVLTSVLLWSPGTLGGDIASAVLLGLAGYLEAVGGTAQNGGLALPALGGLCDGGSLLTAVVGTSVGGGADEGMNACLGTVLDGAELLLEDPHQQDLRVQSLGGPASLVAAQASVLASAG